MINDLAKHGSRATRCRVVAPDTLAETVLRAVIETGDHVATGFGSYGPQVRSCFMLIELPERTLWAVAVHAAEQEDSEEGEADEESGDDEVSAVPA